MQIKIIALGLAIGVTAGAAVSATARAAPASVNPDPDRPFLLAQAMVPPTGMGDADRPMAMEERMRRRFPQPARVGDLIGLPVLDDSDRTIGFVQQVVRTPQGKIELIVLYSRWCGWCGLDARPVAVPIEAVGILGRELASLDMPPSEYAAAPTWRQGDATVLGDADSIRVALARR